jgi:hypothetical protein
MCELHPPAYTLDLRSPLSCAKIEHAAAGHDLGILVRDSIDADKPGILARGTLNDDRTRLFVTVATPEGSFNYDWSYEMVLKAIRSRSD